MDTVMMQIALMVMTLIASLLITMVEIVAADVQSLMEMWIIVLSVALAAWGKATATVTVNVRVV